MTVISARLDEGGIGRFRSCAVMGVAYAFCLPFQRESIVSCSQPGQGSSSSSSSTLRGGSGWASSFSGSSASSAEGGVSCWCISTCCCCCKDVRGCEYGAIWSATSRAPADICRYAVHLAGPRMPQKSLLTSVQPRTSVLLRRGRSMHRKMAHSRPR